MPANTTPIFTLTPNSPTASLGTTPNDALMFIPTILYLPNIGMFSWNDEDDCIKVSRVTIVS